MNLIKHELQNIILSHEQTGGTSQLKKAQNFLSRNAQTSSAIEKQQYLKSEEETQLIQFLITENLFYTRPVLEESFIAEGAEQRVYQFDDHFVIKLNDSIFYSYWLDYLNSLLIHNYFFKATAYELLGFKLIDQKLYAVVKQEFIVKTEETDLLLVKEFLEHNHFTNTRNNDYFNPELGLIFEDLHDENVLMRNGIFYFIDTVFYLSKQFYP